MTAVARLPFMEMFIGKPLSMDIHINIEMRTSPFHDLSGNANSKCLSISFDLPNNLCSGMVHLHDLEHVEIYFD